MNFADDENDKIQSGFSLVNVNSHKLLRKTLCKKQSPSRVVVRYPHHTALQWAKGHESCQIEESVFLLLNRFMYNIVK